MFWIAHRGASYDAPENTLAAVQLAWQQRADAVEIDVRLTKDGKLVAIHDSNTRRTTGRKRKVENSTLAELRALDAGKWKGAKWTNERIPTLEEILATMPSGKCLFIEIKTQADVADTLARALADSHCAPGQIVLIGFSLRMMASLKKTFPQLTVLWVSSLKRRIRRFPDPKKWIIKTRRAGLDGLNLKANRAITPALVKKVHAAGLRLCVWTVDSPSLALKLKHAGIDGITTNRPAYVREQVNALAQK